MEVKDFLVHSLKYQISWLCQIMMNYDMIVNGIFELVLTMLAKKININTYLP